MPSNLYFRALLLLLFIWQITCEKIQITQKRHNTGSIPTVGVINENRAETKQHNNVEEPPPIDWILVFGELFGGLSLFLYGTKMLAKNLKIVAAASLKDVLATLSQSQIVGLFTGTIVTSLLQSSALVTVMLVEFVSSGYMTFNQTLGILLGSGIGSTTASQMMALNVKKYSLYLVTIGFSIQSVAKTPKRYSYGGIFLGLGLIFFGADVLSHSVTPLRTYPAFLELIVEITQHSLLALFVALLFSAFVQSSSAAIGIVIVLASQNLIQLKPAIAMVLGSNIGTSVTAVIAALSSSNEAGHSTVGNTEALRVATANIFFKVVGVFLILPVLRSFRAIVLLVSPADDIARQIANAHTLFNIFVAIIFIPFTKRVGQIITSLVPDRNKVDLL